MTLDMEEWKRMFQTMMQEKKPHVSWSLVFDDKLRPDCLTPGWKQYKQSAFGRYLCSSCRRSWASAKVQVLCHMYLENWKSHGHVHMRIFNQKCKKCSHSQFEKPTFSRESAMRILENLVQRILERYYGGNNRRKVPEKPVVPEVPLEGSHDTANCEACALGCCVPHFPPFYMEVEGHTNEGSRPRCSAAGANVAREGPKFNQEARQKVITGTKPQVSGVMSPQVTRSLFSDLMNSPGIRVQGRKQERYLAGQTIPGNSCRGPQTTPEDNFSGLGLLAAIGFVAAAAFKLFSLYFSQRG